MIDSNVFPDVNAENFTYKAKIYHSLLEARLLRRYSAEFMIQMIESLSDYKEKNGGDIIIDLLFTKYLIHANTEDLIKAVQALSEKGEFKSQFHYGLALLCPIDEFKYLRNKLFIQSWKLCSSDIFILDEIPISKVIAFYMIKKFYSCFSKDMIITNDNILESIKYKLEENNKKYNEKYNETLLGYQKNIESINNIYTYDFWKDYVSGKIIDKFTINVENDPYLFNAAAQMCYANPLIKVNYDVSKLKFPEYITLDMMKLIRYRLSNRNLLDFEPYSIEIKNLCSLVYLLIINNASFKDIERYKDLISCNSFAILILVYMNYTNENVPESFFDYIISKIDLTDLNNIFLVRMINILQKNKGDLLYIASKNMTIEKPDITNENYGLLKKSIFNQKFIETKENDQLIETYKNDFIRFMEKLISISRGDKKLYLIKLYLRYNDNELMNLELVMYEIDYDHHNNAFNWLMKLNPTNELICNLKNDKYFPKICQLMKNVSINNAFEIYEKFNLKDKFDTIQKINVFLAFKLSTCKYDINRKSILQDSLELFKKNDMKGVRIRINYISEKGIDEGGLAKDWFNNVSTEIIKNNTFITVPNGTSLTFNPFCDCMYMYKFAGEFIALAITNKKAIGLKLTSFIWKKMLNKSITLEDMKDYDDEIHQSLKWISENDPKDLMMSFVDSNDEELCENGKNIELTEDNKAKFINLMIEKKLIKPNIDAIKNITEGFTKIIDLNHFKYFELEDIIKIVNGEDVIDIEDWKKSTKHNDETKFTLFFDIISKWSHDDLKKLLKFVTGTSIVPFGGFGYWSKFERSFTIEFLSISSDRLPVSHTCFNKIEIPNYDKKEILEQKLLLAINCDDFGFD